VHSICDTVISQALVANAVCPRSLVVLAAGKVAAFAPRLNLRILHLSASASTYMCSPVRDPQTAGGFDEGLGDVVLNRSTKQFVA